MDFVKLIEEQMTAGGASSAFGPGVGSTATPFSGDNYAPGDARMPKSVFGGVLTRGGMSGKSRKSKKNKKSKRKRSK